MSPDRVTKGPSTREAKAADQDAQAEADQAISGDQPAAAASESKGAQDAAAGDTASIVNPTLQRPEDLALLDKAMTPNQPPPIKSDVAGGQANELERQRRQAEAVREANTADPDDPNAPGGNPWDKEAAALAESADKG